MSKLVGMGSLVPMVSHIHPDFSDKVGLNLAALFTPVKAIRVGVRAHKNTNYIK